MAIRKDCSSCSCWQRIGHNREGPSVDLQVCCKLLTTVAFAHLRQALLLLFCQVDARHVAAALGDTINCQAARIEAAKCETPTQTLGVAHPHERSNVAHKQSRTLQPWTFHRMRQRVRHGATLGSTHAASSHLTSPACPCTHRLPRHQQHRGRQGVGVRRVSQPGCLRLSTQERCRPR